jgi:hypothetical protein
VTDRITLADFLASRQLGGALETFRDLEPWRPWLAFARATYGEALDAGGRRELRRPVRAALPRARGKVTPRATPPDSRDAQPRENTRRGVALPTGIEPVSQP